MIHNIMLQELIGYNNRGIVELRENEFARCKNCGATRKGKKANDWMFGHPNCPKPDGEYIKNDVTPEKLRRIISNIISLVKQKVIEDVMSLIGEDELVDKDYPSEIGESITRNQLRAELRQKLESLQQKKQGENATKQ